MIYSVSTAQLEEQIISLLVDQLTKIYVLQISRFAKPYGEYEKRLEGLMIAFFKLKARKIMIDLEDYNREIYHFLENLECIVKNSTD